MLLQKGVNIIGYFEGQYGLGETARQIVSALEKASIPFELISADFAKVNARTEKYTHTFVKEGKYPINIFCIDLLDITTFIRKKGFKFFRKPHNILLFFWEADIIPQKRVEWINCFDEVWVVSPYLEQILQPVVKVPVHRIAHPVQLNEQGVPDKRSFGLKEQFTFLYCFDFCSDFQRKNPLAIVESFQAAFDQRDDVQLVIKSQNGHLFPSILHPICEKLQRDRRIQWIDESMTHRRRYDLMNACDCYISLHRSEGFGLTMAEAMCMEKPVIATGYSGNLAFMTKENSYLCDYSMVKVGPGNSTFEPESSWAQADISNAAHWMKHVVSDSGDASSKARQGKKDIMQNHSVEAVGKHIGNRIHGISLSNYLTRMMRHTGLHFYYFVDFCQRAKRFAKRKLSSL